MAEKPDPELMLAAEKFVKLMKAKATKSILKQCRIWRKDLAGLEASLTYLYKTRKKSFFVVHALELVGRAKLPPQSDLKRCEHWITNVEIGVARDYASRLPQWIENAEYSMKSLDAGIKSYISRLDGGGDIVVGSLQIAKGAGMVSVSVLAGLFAGPAVITALALEAGTTSAAMAVGVTASVISKNVDIITTNFGRRLSGENLQVGEELNKAILANIDAVATGLVLGPVGAKINSSVTSKLFKNLPLKQLGPEASKNITRLGAGGFNKFLRSWIKSDGKRTIPTASKKVKNKINNKMKENAMMLVVLEEASKSPKFRKSLAEYAKKNAPKR